MQASVPWGLALNAPGSTWSFGRVGGGTAACAEAADSGDAAVFRCASSGASTSVPTIERRSAGSSAAMWACPWHAKQRRSASSRFEFVMTDGTGLASGVCAKQLVETIRTAHARAIQPAHSQPPRACTGGRCSRRRVQRPSTDAMCSSSTAAWAVRTGCNQHSDRRPLQRTRPVPRGAKPDGHVNSPAATPVPK